MKTRLALLLLVFVGVMFTGSVSSGCRQYVPHTASNQVSTEVAIGFATARVALVLLDSAEAQYLDSLKQPTDEQLRDASDRVAKLQAVRDVLERVREHLAGDAGDDLDQALDDLRLLASSLSQAGVKVPPEALTALGVKPGGKP